VLARARYKLSSALPTATECEGWKTAYEVWLETHLATVAAANARITRGPFLSILMPVHNPPIRFLREAIASVKAQTYGSWELCIADDGSDLEVVQELRRLAAADNRLRVVYCDTNSGISAATNRALAIARGDYVGFLDHDDILDPQALASVVAALDREGPLDIVYTDRDTIDANGRRSDPYFKPEWSPISLLYHNYVIHFLVIRRQLLDRTDGLNAAFDGAQDYDLILRLAEFEPRVRRIPAVLYSWRRHDGSNLGNPKPAAFDAGQRAIEAALVRRGLSGSVSRLGPMGPYRTRLEVAGAPHVSIIISSRSPSLLAACTDSVRKLTTYAHYDITVATNAPEHGELAALCARNGFQLIFVADGFFSRMNNAAAAAARGEYVLFLNDDTVILTPEWLEEMVSLCSLPGVVAVGPRLVYPNGRIQFTRVVMGVRTDGRPYFFDPFDHFGTDSLHGFSLAVVSEVSGVSGGCMLTPREQFVASGGFDGETFNFSYQDADWFLRMRAQGKKFLFTPHATVMHYGSFSKKQMPEVFSREVMLANEFFRRHSSALRHGDPYFNPNLLDEGGLLEAPEFPGLLTIPHGDGGA